MNEGCCFRDQCGFYQKFGFRTSSTWKGLLKMYCHGQMADMCERIPFLENGEAAEITDELMPTGSRMPQAFQLLP